MPKRPVDFARARAAAQKKQFRWRFGQGIETTPAIDTAYTVMLQWARLVDSEHAETRESVRAKLRQVVETMFALECIPEVMHDDMRQRNSENGKRPRPGRRRVDHDEITQEFRRLIRQGHTEREANGMLATRGIASASTIRRITKSAR